MTIIPEPEVLSRDDTEHGRWDVEQVPPKRGLPMTSIVEKKMFTPGDDSDMSRTIRAHEMMHAKVSPADDWAKWIERGMASKEAMTVCEEVRVNILCQKAGFDMMAHLSDDGETADGERIAMMGDWHSAVMFAVATAGTASAKKYLNGIRRHRRDWGPHLQKIQKKVVKHFNDVIKNSGVQELASTRVDEGSGLNPVGFRHVETVAEWVDRIAGLVPPEEEKPGEETGETGKGETKPTTPTETGRPTGGKEKMTPEDFAEKIKSETIDSSSTHSIPRWGELKIGRVPLEVVSTGSMGKKRVATNVGRNPRRMTRYMTDPEMRLFDRKIRAKGGIVVLDCSGSMSWSREQIRTVVEMAPGATVLAYSWNREGGDNAWILAKDGKMFRELDNISAGNGVDLPALQWAIENRRHKEPIVWVSDGGVSGVGDGFHESLFRQCAKYVKQNGILCAPDMAGAISLFKKLGKGEKVTTKLPYYLRQYA